MSLLYASTCFEHYVLIIRRSKLYYTASGIITLCRWPSGAQVSYFGFMLIVVLLRFTAPRTEDTPAKCSEKMARSALNLCTGRPPTSVVIPDAV